MPLTHEVDDSRLGAHGESRGRHHDLVHQRVHQWLQADSEPPGWTAQQQATWPASASTLIAGDRGALLVDALLTTTEGERLAGWVKSWGKNLSTIYITHGHGDHFFGAGPSLDAFPQAQLVTLPEVVDDAREQQSPEALATWNSWFKGQFDEKSATPTALISDEPEIDGHVVRFIGLGGSDGVDNTVVRVPELSTVVSGDVVYNNLHMWLWNSTPESRAEWLATLDALAALRPEKIITGRRDPDAPNDDAQRVLAQSRRYIEDFDTAVTRSGSVVQLVDATTQRYSAYGNPYGLLAAAATRFES
ncbi:MBL fold metallo-hydrolase [Streptomyces hirsutus]|uniref:MBL fold metallo-hydrolase n=1 Tax=Streptomyces hirsutus TaxID=35620 RepID=UPI003440FA31